VAHQDSWQVRTRPGSWHDAWHLFSLAGLLVVWNSGTADAQANPVRESRPPVHGFYDKYIDCGGLFIRAARVVDDRALQLACGKVTKMLSRATQAKTNLLEWQAELHIIGRNQQTSDLPELRWARGKDWDAKSHQDIDGRTRGVGGLYSSCGEENLLGLPSDRYAGGSDICVHEFAHAVMDIGLDDALRTSIEEQQRRAISAGLWSGRYAATNPQEYWAELSMWYFGAHGDRGSAGPADGNAALATYDPDGYSLLDKIYSGGLSPPAVKVVPVRMAGASAKLNSTGGGPEASLVLLNNSGKAYAIQWLDFKGQPVDYGTLEKFSYRVMKTFIKHAWRLKDTASGRTDRFMVDAPASRWRVDG
jgi:hypothetical protein